MRKFVGTAIVPHISYDDWITSEIAKGAKLLPEPEMSKAHRHYCNKILWPYFIFQMAIGTFETDYYKKYQNSLEAQEVYWHKVHAGEIPSHEEDVENNFCMVDEYDDIDARNLLALFERGENQTATWTIGKDMFVRCFDVNRKLLEKHLKKHNIKIKEIKHVFFQSGTDNIYVLVKEK